MPRSAIDLLDSIFKNIYNALIPSSLEEADPPTQLLHLMLPGITVDEGFDLTQDKNKQRVYEFVNRVPRVRRSFNDSGRKVTLEYEKILGAMTPDDDLIDDRLTKRYEKAKKDVWDDASNDYTPKYKLYKQRKDAYDKAQQNYLREQNSATPLADTLQRLKDERNRKHDDLIVSGSAEIEADIEIMRRYRAFTPSTLFSQAIQEYQSSESALGHRVDFMPSTWFTKPNELSWELVQLTSSSQEDKVHKDVSSLDSDTSVKFKIGLWGGSATGEYKHMLEKAQTSSKSDAFGVKFMAARVDIQRPWFNAGLLGYPNVYVGGVRPRGICTGSLTGPETQAASFPLLPAYLIVAKEILAFNNFSEEEQRLLNESTKVGAKVEVSYGPFSLGNETHYNNQLTDEEKKAFNATAKIEVGTKMQIIGIVSTVLSPAFPVTERPPVPGLVPARVAPGRGVVPEDERAVTRILAAHR